MSGSSSNIVGGLKNACTCAVQIMEDLSRVAMRDGLPLEATITEGLRHPNVVNTLAHAVVPRAPRGNAHDSAHSNGRSGASGCSGSAPGGSSSGAEACGGSSGSSVAEADSSSLSEARGGSGGAQGSPDTRKAPARKAALEGTAWLLLEFCDKGCLQVGGGHTISYAAYGLVRLCMPKQLGVHELGPAASPVASRHRILPEGPLCGPCTEQCRTPSGNSCARCPAARLAHPAQRMPPTHEAAMPGGPPLSTSPPDLDVPGLAARRRPSTRAGSARSARS